MTKIVLGILAAAICTIVGAKLAFEATAHATPHAVNEAWAQNKMEFVTWNGNRWTAWIRGGAFEHRPHEEGNWHPHANSTLAFIDWNGTPAQAKIEGKAFLIAHHGDWNGSIQRESALRYRDWAGENRLRTVKQLQR